MNNYEVDRRKSRVGYFIKLCKDHGLNTLAEVLEKFNDDEKVELINVVRKWLI